MTNSTKNLEHSGLQARIGRDGYQVDPRRVAEAIIVRLVREGPSQGGPGGPTPAEDELTPLRQAA